MKRTLKFIKNILLFSLLSLILGCEPEEIIVIRKTFQVTASSEKTNIYVNEELPFTVSISNKDINNEEILSASFQMNKSTGYIVFN